MRKILISEHLKKLIVSVKWIVSRFPIPTGIVVILNICLFGILHWVFDRDAENVIIRFIFSLIITFFFSVWVHINSERLNNRFSDTKILLQLIPLGFGFLFFFWFKANFYNNTENIIFFLLNLAWILSYLFFAPYIKTIFLKNKEQMIYYAYFYKIGVIFLISSILSWILCILGNIWIYAVLSLFDIKWLFSNKIYSDWIILATAFIPPIFALIQLPKKESFDNSNFGENIFFSFLIKYIAIPFIFVYFAILYIYSFKVLLNFKDWPKWEVSWLVIGFSIFGYIAYIFSYVFEEKNNFIRIFRKILPLAVIPQLFMLFYAIYLRINQYDITINRYFVVVFGIWLTVVSCYLVFSKKKYLGFIPFILTIFTIIISIGPRSVYNFPEQRQFVRLENNLKKAGILQNWKIIPLKSYKDIDESLWKEIYNGIYYLCDFDDCKKIKELFKDFYKSNDWNNYYDSSYFNSWSIVNNITKNIKVSRTYDTRYLYEDDNVMLNFRIGYNKDIFPIDIKNFSKIIKIGYEAENFSWEYATFDSEKNIIEIKKDWKTLNEIDMKSFVDKIYKNYKNNNDTFLSQPELTFETSNYRIIFETVGILNPEFKKSESWDNEEKPRSYWRGYLLIK